MVKISLFALPGILWLDIMARCAYYDVHIMCILWLDVHIMARCAFDCLLACQAFSICSHYPVTTFWVTFGNIWPTFYSNIWPGYLTVRQVRDNLPNIWPIVLCCS